jgi:hypothetical protein
MRGPELAKRRLAMLPPVCRGSISETPQNFVVRELLDERKLKVNPGQYIQGFLTVDTADRA